MFQADVKRACGNQAHLSKDTGCDPGNRSGSRNCRCMMEINFNHHSQSEAGIVSQVAEICRVEGCGHYHAYSPIANSSKVDLLVL